LNKQESKKPIEVFGAKNKNADIQIKSSSGGIFTIIAEKIIEDQGIVFGARFNKEWEVVHDYVDSKEDLQYLRGSKYVQSNTGDCFKKVEQFLKDGKKVLFSGTPCQVAGLKNFLQKDYENLITIDIVCHGVPSPKVWKKYLAEKFTKDKINSVSLTDKTTGWKQRGVQIKTKETTLTETYNTNLYMRAFLKNLHLRPSCYDCQFKNFNSGSDISLADFWKVETRYKDFFDDNGVSLVLINTSKGQNLISANEIEKIATDLDFAIKCNSPIIKSVLPHKKRNYFFAKYDKRNIEKLIRKCLARPWHDNKQRTKQIIILIFRKLNLYKK
ncbi:MAG: Coenzyme F420 hydrogenase/dehydrogenase, beta subunit C-terminal domain, partial [Bacteroidales bacterium]|nr:Coenzyme F420 hydrogenase/dehydrogenase, beta subunit C-terminal domain [Bacteroidales bacterium]